VWVGVGVKVQVGVGVQVGNTYWIARAGRSPAVALSDEAMLYCTPTAPLPRKITP